tara:strand:- start:4485 stop:4679 length:195 start_codon:yes stop_codon:yes gene_type:complete
VILANRNPVFAVLFFQLFFQDVAGTFFPAPLVIISSLAGTDRSWGLQIALFRFNLISKLSQGVG